MCKMPFRLRRDQVRIMKVIRAMYRWQTLAYVTLFVTVMAASLVAVPNAAFARCVVKGWTNDRNVRPIFKCSNGAQQYRSRRARPRRR